MKSNPLVCIVTPSFNQARFLEETLRSVELQDYRPIHQIVIDGGSRDETAKLLEAWEAQEHGDGYSFEWISEPDRGHADALNKGFDRARGEIVGWLNSDDVYFDVGAIQRSVSAFAQHPDVDLVFGDVALISECSGLQMIWCFPEFNYARALRGYLFSQPTALFRKALIDRHRLEPTLNLAPDTALWLTMGREAKFFHVGAIPAADRDHRGRLTNVSRTALQQAHDQLMRAYGAPMRASLLEKLRDRLTKVCMRLWGLVYLARLAGDNELARRLAFPMWTESFRSAAWRQLTMRLGSRTDMGPHPALTEPLKSARSVRD
jgi:glycosyltransferase involved in cell wall biosynthesis